MITYKERVEIANEYRKWAKDNHVLDYAEAVIAFLEINKIIPGWTHCDEQLPEKEGVYLTAYWCFGRAVYKVCKFSLDLYATSTTDFDKYDDYKHAGFYVYNESADRFIEVAPHAWMEIKSHQPEEIYEF